MRSKPIAIDLFAGSGAVTLGLKLANFNVVGAVDIDQRACATYRANHPEVRLVEADIRRVSPMAVFGDFVGRLDLLAVCAPCQPFSSKNRCKDRKDRRIGLLQEALKFAADLQPRMIFFENVPGIEHSHVFRKVRWRLRSLGYYIGRPRAHNAAELGVPQRRERMTMIAAKSRNLLRAAKRVRLLSKLTVADAIGDLPAAPPKNNALEDPLHFCRNHSDLNIARLKHTSPNGGSRSEWPEELWLDCHRKLKSTNQHPDVYGRMRWDDVAPTLTTGCTDITRGRYAHPEEHRAITVREAARLQSFPDTYIFVGSSGEIATQIGNAVPPNMMKAIAIPMHRALLMPR